VPALQILTFFKLFFYILIYFRLYNEKSWLSVQAVQPTLKASKSENFDKEKALLNQPEDLYKVLNWQSDQLVMLKEQVRLLMSGQQQDTSSTKLTINESGHNLSSARYYTT
jgi:hypothetical protein